jgi:hypothetical protein
MRKLARINLISRIATELQARMSTTQINTFLTSLGVECEETGMVPSKRLYVQSLLSKAPDELVLTVANELELEAPGEHSPTANALRSYLEEGGLSSCRRDFARALANTEKDPDSAIASASSTLESLCKSILDRRGRPYPSDQSLGPLLSTAFDVLGLSPAKAADAELKRLLGGIVNAALAVGVLRTKFSAAHGSGDGQPRLEARHARVAVNACATVSMFLIESMPPDSQVEREA